MTNRKNTRVVRNKKAHEEESKASSFSIKTAELQLGILEESKETIDDRQLARAKLQWYLGDWEALASIKVDDAVPHQYGLLCLMKAAGLQQTGDLNGTLEFATLAKSNNVDSQLLREVLVGGLYHTLGRIHTIQGEFEKAKVKISKGLCLVKKVEDVESGILSRFAREASLHGNSDLAIGMIKKHLPTKIHALRPSELSKRLNELTLSISALKSKSSKPLSLDNHRKMITPGDILLNRAERTIILIAGMRHSGSTLLFNIVRVASELAGLSVKGAYSEKIESTKELADSCQVLLIKTHEYRDDIADISNFTLTTIRDLRDTVASAKRRKFAMLDRVGGVVEYAKFNRALHDSWYKKSDFVFEYEAFMYKPFHIIQQVLSALELDGSLADEIYKRVTSLPKDNYALTLLSDTHITDPKRESTYATTLSPECIEKIESHHRGWLDLYGYMKMKSTNSNEI